MTTIHFVRHGQTDWNAAIRIQGTSESTLSELGMQQARTLRDRLRGEHFDRVFSSDLQRTRQTTDILLDGDTAAVEFRSALREIHLGPWEGVLLDEARQTHPEDVRQFREEPDNFALPGAETFYQLQNRARRAVEDILQTCQDQEVLVVGHGAFIKTLLIEYAGRQMRDLWAPPELHNCAHSKVVWQDGANPAIEIFADRHDWNGN